MSEALTHTEQFANDLHQEVQVKAGNDTNPQMREDAFTELVLELLNEHNESDGAEVCYHSAGSRGRLPAAKVPRSICLSSCITAQVAPNPSRAVR
jgi:hypothetical protein